MRRRGRGGRGGRRRRLGRRGDSGGGGSGLGGRFGLHVVPCDGSCRQAYVEIKSTLLMLSRESSPTCA